MIAMPYMKTPFLTPKIILYEHHLLWQILSLWHMIWSNPILFMTVGNPDDHFVDEPSDMTQSNSQFQFMGALPVVSYDFLSTSINVPRLQSRNMGRQCRRSGLLFWREEFPTGRTSSLLALNATSSFHQMRRWCSTLKNIHTTWVLSSISICENDDDSRLWKV